MKETEIGFNLMVAIVFGLLICWGIAKTLTPGDIERCAKSCGVGRFKAWTDEIHAAGTQAPEKCECAP